MPVARCGPIRPTRLYTLDFTPRHGARRASKCRSPAHHDDQVCLRHRRCGVLVGQGHRVGFAGRDARVAGPEGHPHQARPLPQRRSGHDEPVPARRGVRHRRRRRDRSRPRPLRTLHHHAHEAQQQLHHRPDLQVGAREGTPRRLPRQDRAGDSARHQRDPGIRQARRRRGHRHGSGRGHRRDRRHGRRHRIAALPGSGAPAEPEARARRTAPSCT